MSYIKGTQENGSRWQESLLITKAVGKSYLELIFACDSVDCYPRQTVTVQCHVKDLQAAWPHKRDADTTDIMECFS